MGGPPLDELDFCLHHRMERRSGDPGQRCHIIVDGRPPFFQDEVDNFGVFFCAPFA